MKIQPRGERGFALIAVLGIMVVLLIYLAAAQGSVRQTVAIDAVARGQMEHAGALAAMPGLIPPVDTATTITLNSTPDRYIIKDMVFSAQVAARPLAAGDGAWASLPGMQHRPGDMLLDIKWTSGPAAGTTDRILINQQWRRRGIVRLNSQR